jgi:hypothetical protein
MDLLDHLADVEVPPTPAAPVFTDGVRRKLHPRLLALHVAEFALGATVWAAGHMLVALFAAVVYTVTGSWPRSTRRLPPGR